MLAWKVALDFPFRSGIVSCCLPNFAIPITIAYMAGGSLELQLRDIPALLTVRRHRCLEFKELPVVMLREACVHYRLVFTLSLVKILNGLSED